MCLGLFEVLFNRLLLGNKFRPLGNCRVTITLLSFRLEAKQFFQRLTVKPLSRIIMLLCYPAPHWKNTGGSMAHSQTSTAAPSIHFNEPLKPPMTHKEDPRVIRKCNLISSIEAWLTLRFSSSTLGKETLDVNSSHISDKFQRTKSLIHPRAA